MPNRITFDINNDGVADITVPINPVEVDLAQSIDHELVPTIDGEPVSSLSMFDGRVRTLTWRNIPNKTPYTEMVSGLRLLPYLVSGCQINLRDIHPSLGNSEMIPIRVNDVLTKYNQGAGPNSATNKLSYEYITVEYVLRYTG